MESQHIRLGNIKDYLINGGHAAYSEMIPEQKDFDRLKKIYASNRDMWLQKSANMAKAITTIDKAVRRAEAAVQMAPADITEDELDSIIDAFLVSALLETNISNSQLAKFRVKGVV